MTDTTKEEGSITMKNCTFSWVDPEAVEEIKRRSSSSKKPKKKSKRGKNERRSSSDTTSTNNSIKEEHMKRVNSIQSLASMADSEGGTEQTSTSPHTLRNISCHIPAGSLVAVVGAVGCGKSTFLSAILGEVEPVDDTSKVYIPRSENRKGSPGFVSYCAQTPWILNSTLKENILFGRSFDEERYNEVVHACALSSDLEILPAGDMTEIGERGINLSGGQKACAFSSKV
jgi:ABC-type multidrug transport system fused ATPase/permease subunit